MLVAIKNLKLKSSLPRGELNSLTFQNSGLKICLSTLELYIPNPRLLSVYMARACKEVKLVLREASQPMLSSFQDKYSTV